jgi:hypothetical protein
MRYWLSRADEDWNRALDGATRDDVRPPAPLGVRDLSLVAVLVAGEILLWIILAWRFLLRW